ncbi:MAG: hypothetical protein HYW05_00245 [Candidatus Diapherotrites archaeon]|nr:hypothetical protein [Candidatus Diapherotrites archaeon]
MPLPKRVEVLRNVEAARKKLRLFRKTKPWKVIQARDKSAINLALDYFRIRDIKTREKVHREMQQYKDQHIKLKNRIYTPSALQFDALDGKHYDTLNRLLRGNALKFEISFRKYRKKLY